MFWPIVLPAQLTFWIMVALILIATIAARVLNRKPGRVFFLSSSLALIAFIPSCAGIKSMLDARRFGVFHFATFADVRDFRIERYLPTSAQAITLEKTAIGHRAMYSISETEMRDYLDRLWREGGDGSLIARVDLNEGEAAEPDEIKHQFRDLGWPKLQNAIRFQSPVQDDGGRAIYFFDRASGTAYHRAGYW